MQKWTDYILSTAKIVLKDEGKFDEETKMQFLDIENHCKGVSHNPFGEDRMQTNPEFKFNYDISNCNRYSIVARWMETFINN